MADQKACSKHELPSHIGLLHHAASVVVPGRRFICYLTELSKAPKQLDFMVCLKSQCVLGHLVVAHIHSNLEWDELFAFSQIQGTITSEASGSWGCSTFSGSEWFQLKWPKQIRELNITVMEVMLPILFAAAMWGSRWQSLLSTCHCDNKAVATIVNKRSAKDPGLPHILSCISLYAAHYHFSHLPDQCNQVADALSGNNIPLFFSLLPQANPVPDRIPPEAIQMTMRANIDWTSPDWTALFRATLSKA